MNEWMTTAFIHYQLIIDILFKINFIWLKHFSQNYFYNLDGTICNKMISFTEKNESSFLFPEQKNFRGISA